MAYEIWAQILQISRDNSVKIILLLIPANLKTLKL